LGRATATVLLTASSSSSITPPAVSIAVGERSGGGQVWSFTTTGGASFTLDHEQADTLIVRILEAPAD